MNTFLTDRELASLQRVADILIPGSPVRPKIADIADYGLQLEAVAQARDWDRVTLHSALEAVPSNPTWDGLAALADSSPAAFEVIALLVSAAYYMSPAVLAALGYPTERRHPASEDEFATEFESGILDDVMNRPEAFRAAP